MKRNLGKISIIVLLLSCVAAFAEDVVPKYQSPDELKVDPVTLPAAQKHTLANGLTVYLVEKHKLPTVTFRILIKSGSNTDPDGLYGITDFSAGLLRKGLKWNGAEFNAPRISAMTDSVGGMLYAGASFDEVYAGSGGLSKHSQMMLDLLAASILAPTFPEPEIKRAKALLINSFIGKRDEPDDIAREVFFKSLYGNHSLGRPEEGDSASVVKFTRDDVLKQWARIAIPNNSLLAVVGDFDSKEMLKRVDKLFGGWKPGAVPEEPKEAVVNIKGVEVRIVDKPDAVQTSIRMGHQGISRFHPDYYNAMVMAQILSAGGFDSRLMQVARSDKGLTYGIGGGFRYNMKIAGAFSIGTSTRNAATYEMLKTIFDVINEFKRNGPTDDEVKQAKMYLTGSYPLNFETPNDIAEQILYLDRMGLPAKTIPEYRMRIAKVTKGDVTRVAGDLLHTDKLIITLVGNAQEIRPQLMQLNMQNLNSETVPY